MKQLNLRLYKDLTVNEDNELTVAVSMEDGNGLQILSGDHPGLYLELAQAISSGANLYAPTFQFDMSDIGLTNNWSLFMLTTDSVLYQYGWDNRFAGNEHDAQTELWQQRITLNPDETDNLVCLEYANCGTYEDIPYSIPQAFQYSASTGPHFTMGRQHGSGWERDDYIDKEKHKVYGQITLKGNPIHASSQVHRVFTSNETSPLTRLALGEWVLPGDIYRHPEEDGTYTYYLIISVTGQRPVDTYNSQDKLVKSFYIMPRSAMAESWMTDNAYSVTAGFSGNQFGNDYGSNSSNNCYLSRNYVREMVKLGRW